MDSKKTRNKLGGRYTAQFGYANGSWCDIFLIMGLSISLCRLFTIHMNCNAINAVYFCGDSIHFFLGLNSSKWAVTFPYHCKYKQINVKFLSYWQHFEQVFDLLETFPTSCKNLCHWPVANVSNKLVPCNTALTPLLCCKILYLALLYNVSKKLDCYN